MKAPFLSFSAVLSALVWICLLSGPIPLKAAAGDKPNVIYIMADDLGYGDLGCYGQKIMKTPRIDEMAAEGMKFTQHYAGSALCAPTRSCLMTGTHTGHTRVRNNGGADGDLHPEDFTVGELLKQVGYATGAIGKWGVGEAGTTGIPTRQGFDFFFGYLNQSNAHHYYPPFLWRNEEKELYPDNPEKRTHYSHDLMTDEALGFIREHKDGPFFLYVPYTIPHVSLDVPEDSMAPYVGTIEETEPYGTPGGQHYRYEEKPHAAFAGMVSRLDRDVGRILDLVEELGIAENTLVIFTSDNGPTSAGGADPKFFDGNGPLRGIKFEFYEGGIREPMIAWWPGTVAPGTESDHVSAHWDLMPTLAELTGQPVPESTDGISFLPTLLGNSAEQKQHAFLYWEWPGGGGVQAVRQGDWKGIRHKLQKDADAPIELYNLANDLGEETDVAAQHPDVVAEIHRIMTEERIAPDPDPLFTPAKPKKAKKKKSAE